MIPSIFNLESIISHKIKGMYPTHIAYKVDIPPGATIEAYLKIPDGKVFIVPGEIHDVPTDTFVHSCIKDDFLVLPETMIDGTSMILPYPEPIIVERYWRGRVKNVTTETATFRLRVPFLCAPAGVIKEIREEVIIKEDLVRAYLKRMGGLTPEERIRLLIGHPGLAIAIAR